MTRGARRGRRGDPPMPQRSLLLLVFAAFAIIVVSAIVNLLQAQREFADSQRALGTRAVEGTGKQVELVLSNLRRGIGLFVLAERERLAALDGHSAPEALAPLMAGLRIHLPEVRSVAIAGADGATLIQSGQAWVGETCRRDIVEFLAGGGERHATYLHTNPRFAHLGVMARLPDGSGRVLLAAVDPRLIADVLRNNQPPGHRLLLLLRERGGVIEMSATGDRSRLDGETRLSQAELARLYLRRPVAGSRWELVGLPEAGLLSRNRQMLWRQAGLILAIAVPMLAYLAWLTWLATGRLERSRQAFKQISLHDALTGLPNRSLLFERLQQKMTEAPRDGRRFALMLMDLDGFKAVNDSLGHQVGDLLLQQVAEALRELLRDVDTVARLGGDEFAILAQFDKRDQAEIIAAKVLACLDEPLDLRGTPVRVDASIGVALFPEHGRTPEALLESADAAMYRAKERGVRAAVFDSQGQAAETGLDRLALLAGLKDAIQKGELRLVYQPKQALFNAGLAEAEVLLRWHHPRHGELTPDAFMPLAEQTGLVVELTRWVIKRTLQLAGELNRAGGAVTLAVNLSVRELEKSGLSDWLSVQLEAYHVPPELLRIEVTESTIMSNPDEALRILRRVAGLGIGISIDDFGVGHSSLGYLARLPVDELKIDRSFIRGMHESERNHAIVRATVDLGHDLGMRVVAEGVETSTQARELEALGCDLLQGHLISEPLAETEFRAWLARSQPAHRSSDV